MEYNPDDLLREKETNQEKTIGQMLDERKKKNMAKVNYAQSAEEIIKKAINGSNDRKINTSTILKITGIPAFNGFYQDKLNEALAYHGFKLNSVKFGMWQLEVVAQKVPGEDEGTGSKETKEVKEPPKPKTHTKEVKAKTVIEDKPKLAYQERYDRHQELVNLLHETYKQKNEAYNNSFGRAFQEIGPISGLTRMYDKWERIKNLMKKDQDGAGDESLIDSLIDLSNYCLMTVIELEKNKE